MNMKTLIAFAFLAALPVNAALAASAVEVVENDAVPADTVKVDMSKMKYAPANVEVEAGATVTWTNHDAVPHNVHLKQPVEIVGAMLRAGQSATLRFNEPGDYNYTCSPHPFMKGKVTVKPKS